MRAERSSQGTTIRGRLTSQWQAALAMPKGTDQNAALLRVFEEAIEPAPDLAEKILRDVPVDAGERVQAVERWIMHLLSEGLVNEAINWAESHYSEQDRRAARGAIAAKLMETEPEKALGLLEADDFSEQGADSTSGQVLQMWTAKDPSKAVVWASRLPDGNARKEGFRAVFSSWASSDGAEAMEWISYQTNPHVREDAIDGMAGAFRNHPDFLLEQVIGHSDTTLHHDLKLRIDELKAKDQPEDWQE